MKISLELNYPWKYSWSENEGFHWIGYAFNGEKCYQSAADFGRMSFEKITQLVPHLKGCFSLVWYDKNELLVYTDTAASFPLFYSEKEDEIILTDTPQNRAANSLEQAQITAYTSIYCTEGNQTLLQTFKSLHAGHLLRIDANGNIKTKKWFQHYIENKIPFQDSFSDRYIQITKLWAKQIQALSSPDTTLLIPLSGGYDSRMIVCLLNQAGCKNILCYTYGHPESHERKIAEQVARKLQVAWEFIPYDANLFQAYFTESWINYASKNHHFQSVPHEQDFFALTALKAKGLLEKPFIAIPGFCGDISGGSFLEKENIDVRQQIQKKYGYSGAITFNETISSNDAYQEWLVMNRLSKFIVNSVRVYEHFGGRWALPMWHQDFLQLFYSLPFSERLHEKRYLALAFRHYFEPMQVAFKKPDNDAPESHELKTMLKSILPKIIVQFFQKRNATSPVADPCNLHVLYDLIYEQKFEHKAYKNYNINELNALQTLQLIVQSPNTD